MTYHFKLDFYFKIIYNTIMQNIKNKIIELLGGITEEEFQSAYDWYFSSISTLKKINKELKEKLTSAEKRLEELSVKNIVKSKGQAKTVKVISKSKETKVKINKK